MNKSYSILKPHANRLVNVVSPLRIDLFGNWSDHPDFLDLRPSRVINTACCLRPGKFPINVRLSIGSLGIQYSSIDLRIKRQISFDHLLNNPIFRPLLEYYQCTNQQEFLQKLSIRRGLELTTISEVALRSGLGASSALTVCVLLAVHSINGSVPSKIELAERAYMHESAVAGCGWQDHYSSVFGCPILVERSSMASPAKVTELPSSLIKFVSDYGTLVFVSAQAHSSVNWKVEGNKEVLLKMDDIVEDVLSQLPTLTLTTLMELLSDSEKLSRTFLPSQFCMKLDAILEQLTHLRTCGFFVGMGPAAVILSEHPRQVREILTELGLRWHYIYPTQIGASPNDSC